MARSFDGVGDYLTAGGTVLSQNGPFTVSFWALPDSAATLKVAWWQGEDGTFGDGHDVNFRGDLPGPPIRLTSYVGGVQDSCETTNDYETSSWNHICAIVTNSTTRRIILNGDWASSGTDTASKVLTASDEFRIARPGHSSSVDFYGLLGAVGHWSAALTQWEVEALANGAHPMSIRPDNLEDYWDIGEGSPEQSYISGGNGLTISGAPSVSEHPPISMEYGDPTREAALVTGVPTLLMYRPSLGGGFQ